MRSRSMIGSVPPMRHFAARLALVLALTVACSTNTAGTTVETPHDSSTTAEPEPAVSSLTGILDEASFKALHQLTEAEAPPPRGEMIDLAGTKAYLALPEGATAPMPAVVVIHEWWGLNDHIRHWTDRLAEDGYAALAVDLYGGQVATDPDGAMALMKAVDEPTAAAILAAAHAFLAQDPRIAADRQGVIGWCFGGGWSLRDAIANPELDAAVIYYGHPVTDPAALERIRAPLLGVFANRDQSIPPDVVDGFDEALATAGKSIELHRYDAVHAFANPSSANYDQAAAADAWQHVRTFLAAKLRGDT